MELVGIFARVGVLRHWGPARYVLQQVEQRQVVVTDWWHRHRKQKNCFHHEIGGNPANTRPAVSWIQQQIIETGKAKMFWCTECEKTWFG